MVHSVLEVYPAELSSLPHLTCNSVYPSLYVVSISVLIDREITRFKGENQSPLLHLQHIVSCLALSGYEEVIILFVNICEEN